MHEYTDGYVGIVCVFLSVGALLGATIGALLYALWDDAGK